MATRHNAPPGFPAPQRRSRQAKSSPGQPSLSRKERQQAYLVRDLVAELEHKHGTNTVHAINFSFGKRSTSVSIVLNRERGIQDTHGQHEVADGPHISDRQPRGSQSKAARPPHLPAATQWRSAGRGDTPPKRPVNSAPMGAAAPPPTKEATRVEDMTKDDVNAIEYAVKQAITPIVRALGGNESNGGALLEPPVRLKIGSHTTGTIRLPTGCKAAAIQPDAFKTMLLKIYEQAQLGETQEHAIQRLFANLFDPREVAGAASAPDASMAESDY